MQTVCGTHRYLAPELVECDRGYIPGYGPAIDMWGVGVVTYIMLFGENPFDRANLKATHDAILYAHVPFPARTNVSSHAVSFLQQLLRRDPKERLSAAEALTQTPWLADDSETPCIELSSGADDSTVRPVQHQLSEWNAKRLLKKVFNRNRDHSKHRSSLPVPGDRSALPAGPVTSPATEKPDELAMARLRRPSKG